MKDAHVWRVWPEHAFLFTHLFALEYYRCPSKIHKLLTCLFSCLWSWAKIATRYLIPELAGTRLTPKLCSRVADAFVSKYGKYAGWAQTLLFIAELPSQKTLLQSDSCISGCQKPVKQKGRRASGNQVSPYEYRDLTGFFIHQVVILVSFADEQDL